MSSIREGVGSPFPQGEEEALVYRFPTPFGVSAPTSPVVKLYIYDAEAQSRTDVSGTNLAGSATVSGDVISSPVVVALTAGVRYRLEVKFVGDGNTLEGFIWIDGEW